MESYVKNKLIGANKRKKLIKEGTKIRGNIENNIADDIIGTKGIIQLFADHYKSMSIEMRG